MFENATLWLSGSTTANALSDFAAPEPASLAACAISAAAIFLRPRRRA